MTVPSNNSSQTSKLWVKQSLAKQIIYVQFT